MYKGVISVDPGLRKCGVAYFTPSGAMTSALTVNNDPSVRDVRGPRAWAEMARNTLKYRTSHDLLVIETMQVDARTRGKEKDLLEVQGVVGAIVGYALGMGMTVISYTPRQWKGSLPKNVMHARFKQGVLSKKELGSIHSKATHDALDAIGIGLHYFNRLKR